MQIPRDRARTLEHVNSDKLKNFFHELGLRNIIFTAHPTDAPPNTKKKNQNNISIDGAWCTALLHLLWPAQQDIQPNFQRAIPLTG